jgi:hypothetical protein
MMQGSYLKYNMKNKFFLNKEENYNIIHPTKTASRA